MLKPKIPETAMPELRELWHKAQGAAAAAAAAQNAANAAAFAYQAQAGACLRMLGIDPAKRWNINLDTGEVAAVGTADDEPEVRPLNVNAGANGSSKRPEGDAVEADRTG